MPPPRDCDNVTLEGPLLLHTVPVPLLAVVTVTALFGLVIAILLLAMLHKVSRKGGPIIISWTGADFVGTFLILACAVAGLLQHGRCYRNWCVAWEFCALFPFMTSLTHAQALSIERLLAVLFSPQHERLCRPSSLKAYCIVVWVISVVVLGALSVPLPQTGLPCPGYVTFSVEKTSVITVIYVIFSSVTLCVYIKIAYTANVAERRIHVTNTLAYEGYRADVRLSMTYFGCAVSVVVQYLPIVAYIVHMHMSRHIADLTVPIILLIVAMMSCIVRPLIITLGNKDGIKSCLFVLTCKREN